MYYPKQYKEIDREKIRKDAFLEGFHVSLIKDRAGTVYKTHVHSETKYLFFLSGSMRVTVDGSIFNCLPGDKLIIPGNIKHSAIVGQDGCEFYWSERIK